MNWRGSGGAHRPRDTDADPSPSAAPSPETLDRAAAEDIARAWRRTRQRRSPRIRQRLPADTGVAAPPAVSAWTAAPPRNQPRVLRPMPVKRPLSADLLRRAGRSRFRDPRGIGRIFRSRSWIPDPERPGHVAIDGRCRPRAPRPIAAIQDNFLADVTKRINSRGFVRQRST